MKSINLVNFKTKFFLKKTKFKKDKKKPEAIHVISKTKKKSHRECMKK